LARHANLRVVSGSLPEILTGDYAPARLRFGSPRSIRVVDWNIDRGQDLTGILKFLMDADADLLVIQEVDINARRTNRVNVAEEIARKLKLNYVWAREFQELVQGTSDSPAYTGQATFARWRLNRPRVIRFRNQSDFWKPHWFVPRVYPFQVRSGGRVALVTESDGGGANLATYNLHLESRNTDALRLQQLKEVMTDSARYSQRTPALVAGDFNLNATHEQAAEEIGSSEFRGVIGQKPGGTTHLLFVRGPSIDWAFLRGPVQSSAPKVHKETRASDHFPISFTLTFG
jgi:endonuclease/exonuclease/phosphatase family metal-dependent hydrolase